MRALVGEVVSESVGSGSTGESVASVSVALVFDPVMLAAHRGWRDGDPPVETDLAAQDAAADARDPLVPGGQIPVARSDSPFIP